MEPLITIIIPVYKVEKYLARCLDSVISQTYENLEIIVVDDGSPDSCPEICDQYATKDERIMVIHQTNQGQSSARNAGLDRAKGKYIAFVDSDDYVDQNYIRHMYQAISHNKADFVICAYFSVAFGKELSLKLPKRSCGIITRDEYWMMETTDGTMCSIALWNKLFKSELWTKLRFKEGRYAEDSFAMTQYVKEANCVYVMDEPLYYYVHRADSEVHRFEIKNMDSMEARLERADYYYQEGNRKALRNCLSQVRGGLAYVYQRLDVNEPAAGSRYHELRERYKKLYKLAYIGLDPLLSQKGRKNAVYKYSDTLYAHLMGMKRKTQ